MSTPANRRILLHVGSPKCGSTYLQSVLLRNAALLAEHGIRYPHDGGGHPGNAARIDQLDRAGYDRLFEDGMHTVILSHEDLFSMARRGRPLAEFAGTDGAEVHVLAFLRPFSEFVFGDYSQFMKQFFEEFLTSRQPYHGQSFRQFALRRVEKLQPATFLENWRQCFGPDAGVSVSGHRQIRPVVTGLLGAGLALDWDLPRHLTNPSLRAVDCDRIARSMRDPDIPDTEIRALFKKAFQRTDAPDPGRSDKRKRLIESAFAAQNRALFEAFGYDNTLPELTDNAAETDASPGARA